MAYIDTYNVEYSDDIKTLVKAPKDLEGEYHVNSGVTTIAYSAFKGCDKLTEIHLPSTFKALESSVFLGCKALKAIYYNGDLYDWLKLDWMPCFDTGYSLYLKGELVSEITIPQSVSVIKPNAFYWCSSLKKVSFHSEITQIGASAFNKTSLTGLVEIPEGVQSIGPLAFFSCSFLVSIKLPSTVKDISYGILGCCYNLKNITVSQSNTRFKSKLGVLYDNQGLLKAIAPYATTKPLQLPHDICGIDKDTFCYEAVPKGGLALSKDIVSIKPEAFLQPKGLKIFIPIGTTQYFRDLGIPMDDVHEMFSIDTAFLPGHNCITAIANNPFRLLGVYSNATQKEITANARKIKRFIEVGKQIEFPSDLNGALPPLSRSSEQIDEALSILSNPLEKFKAALFWFIRTDEIEGIALDNLFAGNLAKAKDILQKRSTWASSLNYCVLSFIENRYEEAVEKYTSAIHNGFIYEDLSEVVCGTEFEVDENAVAHAFIDILLEDLAIPECRALFEQYGTSTEDENYLREILYSKYTKIINDAISTAKNTSGGPKASLSAAIQLKESTQIPLAEFAQHAGANSAEYTIIADRLANQILQCAIDYYNNSTDKYAVFEALDLAEYALSIAKGSVKKDRCRQNVDILNKNAAKIPPKEVAGDDDYLKFLISVSKNMSGTIDVAWSILEKGAAPIAHIKECLNKVENNTTAYKRLFNYYINISTSLINVTLSKLIDAVNSSRGDGSIVKQAWDLTLNMDNFPMDEEFKKNRYDENRSILRSMRSSSVAFGTIPSKPKRVIDLRTSEEVWESCKTIQDYEDYLKRFPNGSHIRAAKSRIEKLILEKEDQAWKKAQNNNDYHDYISEYPTGRYIEKAVLAQRDIDKKREELIVADDNKWKSCKSKEDCEQYIANNPNGRHVKDAQERIKKYARLSEGLIWLIAIELVTISILLLKILCEQHTFQSWSTIIIIIATAIAFFVIVSRYSKNW